MARIPLVLTALMMVNPAGAAGATITVDAFADILFWAGSGTNRAALVLEFPTAVVSGTEVQAVEPTAIAWGYRWNGSATMADMLFAVAGTIRGAGAPAPVAGADSRLAIDVTDYGQWGWGIDEIAYDQRGLPAGWSDVVRTIGTDFLTWSHYPAQYALPAAQGTWTGGSFDANQFGISFLSLTPGGWYGVLEADGSGSGPPSEIQFSQPVAAVPEPSAMALVTWAAAAAAARRRFALTLLA